MTKIAKNTICLWFDRDAEEAARFYARTFPDSSVGELHLAPGDYPSGKQGDVLAVEFTVMGIPCLGLNGGPSFEHNEAFSFQVATAAEKGGRDDETDLYRNHGGYARVMHSRTAGHPRPRCGTAIERIRYLGGACCFCPACQE